MVAKDLEFCLKTNFDINGFYIDFDCGRIWTNVNNTLNWNKGRCPT